MKKNSLHASKGRNQMKEDEQQLQNKINSIAIAMKEPSN